jgi:hypothetical protein
VEDFVGEPLVVLAHHRDLQFLARAEVGEHARLAHVHQLGQRADRQAFEPVVRRQAERHVEDRGPRLPPLGQRPRGGSGDGRFGQGRNKTNGRTILTGKPNAVHPQGDNYL